ncbi:MAG TPA: sensor histidine kinase [Terriglobales bacterium]|jgi:signal transduction histidine kinase
MKSRSLLLPLVLGFGTLVMLIAILGVGAIRRARAIYDEMETTQDAYLQSEAARRDIATDMYLAGILVRDYLLDPSPQNAPQHRQQLLEIRSSLQQRLDELPQQLGDAKSPSLPRLQSEVQSYWDSLDPIFNWTPQEKAAQSWYFLRHGVFPHRQAVVDLAHEMAKLNQENLEREREHNRESQRVLHDFLNRIMSFALGLGIVVALVTTYRVSQLETQREEQRKQIEQAENDLRRLSHSLVQAQEVERKSLSRELHDEVGQMLTALQMQLGNLEALKGSDLTMFSERLEEAKRVNSDAMKAIRDLAMGLRPSMLDDLGLEPALEWQGREFSRHTGVPAIVKVSGALQELSDAQRTCIYRVVQEALTNCARHAKARNVLVSVDGRDDRVHVSVKDDGVGFESGIRARRGLGLIGMEERVHALRGEVTISSLRNKGTTIEAEIPIGVSA